MPEYFNYKDAMEYMGFSSRTTLREYIKQGLPIIQVGNSKRISKAQIDKFMKEHCVVTSQGK